MPLIEAKTNLREDQIPEGLEGRFNNHFAPLWGKDPSVRFFISVNDYFDLSSDLSSL